MKSIYLVTLLAPASQGFAPLQPVRLAPTSSWTKVALHNLPEQWSDLQTAFSSFSLADALEGTGDALAGAGDGLAGAGDALDAAATDNGWFGFLTGPIEGLLDLIHSLSVAVGLDANAWGISIIMLTVLIKVLTFPLTKSQLESTSKMQAMSPAIKEIQAKYQSNPEVMNQKVAEFYQVNEINPLAGCIPSLVQIPVFIGLYRAVLNLAKENKLDEPFLFLPNLEGPTYGADPAHGSDWLFSGWTDAGPPLGWDDTISFLILPVLLVVSQFLSMELMQPKTDDPAQQQSNVILKVLPLLIGWFSLNVPAALCVYWFVNNIVTTATSVAIRSSLNFEPVAAGASSASASATMEPPPTIFAPPREKPAGFGQAAGRVDVPRDAVKPLTTIDVEVEKPAVEEVTELTTDPVVEAADTAASEAAETEAPKRRKRGKRARKRKNN